MISLPHPVSTIILEDCCCWMVFPDVHLIPRNLFLDQRGGSGHATLLLCLLGAELVSLIL